MKAAAFFFATTSIIWSGILLISDGGILRIPLGISLLLFWTGIVAWALYDVGRDDGRSEAKS